MSELPDSWYYASGSERKGPVPLDQLRSMLENGLIQDTSLVWAKGMGNEWKPASQVPGLIENAQPQPSSGLKVARPTPPPVEPSEPDPSQNVAMAAIQAAAQAQSPSPAVGAPGAPGGAPAPVIGPPAGPSPVWKIIKYLFLAAILGGGIYYYMTNIYKSQIAKTYEEFAQTFFEQRFDDAYAYCVDGSAAYAEVKRDSRRKPHPLTRLTKAGKVEVISKSYEVLDELKGPDKMTAKIQMKQSVRVGISYSPYQARVVNIHDADLIKEGDTWKVNAFTVEFQAAYDPMSGKKMDPVAPF